MKIPTRIIVGIVFRDPLNLDYAHRLWWDSEAMRFEVDTGALTLTLETYLTMFPQHRGECRYCIARAMWEGVPTDPNRV